MELLATRSAAWLGAPVAPEQIGRIGGRLTGSDVVGLLLAAVAFVVSFFLGPLGLLVIWIPTAALFIFRPALALQWTVPFLVAQMSVDRIGGTGDSPYAWASMYDEALLATGAIAVGVRCVMARTVRLPPGWLLFTAFAACALVSTLTAGPALLTAALGTALTLKTGIAYLVVSQITLGQHSVQRLTTITFASGSVVLVIAGLQWLGLATPWPSYERFGQFAATSVFGQHTVFASGAALLTTFAASLVLSGRHTITGAGLTALGVVGVILSTARRVLVTVPIGLGIMLLTSRQRTGFRPTPRQIGVGLAVVVALTILLLPRLIALGEGMYTEYIIKADVRDRYDLYGTAFQLLWERPLFGWGPGTFGSWTAVLTESPLFQELPRRLPEGQLMGAPYASFLTEFGLVGTAILMAAVIRVLLAMIRLASTPGPASVVAFAAGAALIGLSIEQVVHPVLNDSFVGLLTFGAAGIAVAVVEPERHREKRSA